MVPGQLGRVSAAEGGLLIDAGMWDFFGGRTPVSYRYIKGYALRVGQVVQLRDNWAEFWGFRWADVDLEVH